jgi:AAA domain
MPLEFHDAFNEPPTTKLKIAIVGKEKNGKSWLAASGRKNVLVHDFDRRAEALQGKKGVYVISYTEPGKGRQPEAAQKFLDILGKLEDNLDLSLLGFNVPKDTFVRTNVIDSIQTFGRAFQSYALYCQKDIRREITFGGMKVFLPGGWDAWNAEMVPVEDSILRLLALPSDTIINLHETAEEAADSTSEKPKFTGRVGVFPVRYQRLIKYFNELWRVRLTQSIVDGKSAYLPKVYGLPTYEFDAASALKIDAIEEPSIEAMIAKHEKRVNGLLSASTQTKVLPAAVKI